MDTRLELRHLRYFVAVAEELHFGRAAQRLHMAQPPLSQQIRKLEELVGTELFHRTSRSVVLTPAGRVFLDRGRRLLRQLHADVEEAARIGRGESGRLDVGFISSAIPLGITDLIQAFRTRFPDVYVQIHEGFTSHVVARVLSRDIDLGVVRDAEPHPAISATPLTSEGFVAVVPLDHPCAGLGTIDAGRLRDDPFVFFPRAAGERAFRRNLQPCSDAGYEPRITQEASHWVTILHLVDAGLGVTIAPESATINVPPNVRVLQLTGTSATSEVQFVRRLDDTRAMLDNLMRLSSSSIG